MLVVLEHLLLYLVRGVEGRGKKMNTMMALTIMSAHNTPASICGSSSTLPWYYCGVEHVVLATRTRVKKFRPNSA